MWSARSPPATSATRSTWRSGTASVMRPSAWPGRCTPGRATCSWHRPGRRPRRSNRASWRRWRRRSPRGWPPCSFSSRPRSAAKWSRRWSKTATAGCSSSACCSARGSCGMAEMAELLEEAVAGKGRQVYLFEGDEYLARTSARELAEALVPPAERALNLVVIDASAGAREIASHLMTIGMFAAPKAVLVEGADAFAEEVDAERELSRARDLWQGQRQRDAAPQVAGPGAAAGGGAADVAFGPRAAGSRAERG